MAVIKGQVVELEESVQINECAGLGDERDGVSVGFIFGHVNQDKGLRAAGLGVDDKWGADKPMEILLGRQGPAWEKDGMGGWIWSSRDDWFWGFGKKQPEEKDKGAVMRVKGGMIG
jgi:hypothetical protein